MKKIKYLAIVAVVLTVFGACQKDELKTLPDEGIAKTGKADVYLENDYLAFKNMNAVDSVMNMLSKMSRQEKDAWEQKMGFKSARCEFEKLFDEYEMLKSYDDFLAFKRKNLSKLRFNEMDDTDCSIDYPFISSFYRNVLNSQGIFKVGLSLIQYTKESHVVVLDGDINKLRNLNANLNAKNVIVFSKLKSGGTLSTSNELDNFYQFDPSGDNYYWWTNNDYDRRMLNLLCVDRNVYWNQDYEGGPTYVTKTYQFYISQRAQAKSWPTKWVNYSTVYEFKNVLCKLGSGGTMQWSFYNGGTSPETSSTAYWLLPSGQINESYSGGANLNYIPIPMFSVMGDLKSRGFENYTSVIHQEHYYFP